MILYNIVENSSDNLSVSKHLKRCDELFLPKLSTTVSIDSYANKLSTKAERFEIWETKNLIALLAYYTDIDTIFISNISVERKYQGNQLGFELLDYLIKKYKSSIYKCITLEVFKENKKAFKFYSSNGFVFFNETEAKIILKYNLK